MKTSIQANREERLKRLAIESRQLLDRIQNKIPEFDAVKGDKGWRWTFRCIESEKTFITLTDCFIDFAANNVSLIDGLLGISEAAS